MAAAGGELLGAVFNFLGELVEDAPAPPPRYVEELRGSLARCVDEDEQGRQRLTITLPSRDALDGLASTLARFVAGGDEAEAATLTLPARGSTSR